MKIRLVIIGVLSVNLLIIMGLSNSLIEEVARGGNIETSYNQEACKLNKQNELIETTEYIKMTEQTKPESTAANQKNENNSTVQIADNGIKSINTEKDSKQIGIVITNNGNIHHDKIEILSDGVISVYYGKKLQNIKTFSGKLVIKGSSYYKNSNVIKITSDKNIEIEGLSKASFDGFFYVYNEPEGFVVVNRLSVEKYLYGVVGSEMPSSFETEALKAQAVCARTYTYAHLNNEKYKKYNAIMDDTVSYQAYGNTKVTKKVKDAVKATRGEVLTNSGKLINAYYFSTSCGFTTDSSIWGNQESTYLKSKYVSQNENVINVSTNDYFNQFIKSKQEDYEKNCAFYRWNVTINMDTIRNKVYQICGLDVGKIDEIIIINRGAGGIVSEIEIIGDKEKATVSNQNQIRQVFSPEGYSLKLNDGSVRTNMKSLPSAFFIIEKKADADYTITGGGFGHGSGMSQYGAHEMAKSGKKYKEILNFFYTDVICGRTNIQLSQRQ